MAKQFTQLASLTRRKGLLHQDIGKYSLQGHVNEIKIKHLYMTNGLFDLMTRNIIAVSERLLTKDECGNLFKLAIAHFERVSSGLWEYRYFLLGEFEQVTESA
jgi:hypothetical protein